jgi:cytochrome c-type biogenesis protein CcmF
MAFVGVIGSSFFKTEVKQSVRDGQSFQIGSYRLVYLGLSSTDTPHVETVAARVSVMHDGKLVEVMEPAKLFYKQAQQPATHVAIRSTLTSDLYLVLAGVDNKSGLATFQVFLTPLVSWLWLGGFIMAFGTVVAIWPNAREREAIAAATRRRMAELQRELAAEVGNT